MLKNKRFIVILLISVLFTALISASLTLFAFSNYNNLDKFVKAKNLLTTRYYLGTDENKLIDNAISGMANSLGDKYTTYYTKKQWADLQEDLEGSYVGIGIRIKVGSDGLIAVAEFLKGSSAKAAGLQIGDKIVKVNDFDVRKLKSDKVIEMIKGKEGTKVKLTITRGSNGDVLNFNVRREKIKVDNVTSKIINGNIGYINIRMFDVEVAKYFNESLDKLLKAGIKGLVIDVRDDPGGYYEQVIAIADRILPEGVIVYTEDKNKRKDIRRSDKTELKLPLAVLINGNSASASEILAGAIKDHKKGQLVGTRSYGKGLVQSSFTFRDGSALKLTIQRYFTPSGVCIQGKGIEPNVEVKLGERFQGLPVTSLQYEDDIQLKKAVDIVKAGIK